MSNVNQVMLADIWPLMEEQLSSGKSVKLQPSGTSMLPMIKPWIDTVLLTKAPDKLKKYDIPLYRTDDGRFILHRVISVKGDSYTICGDNRWQLEVGILPSQILALTKGYWHDGEYISCDNKKYLRYCKKRVLRQRLVRLYFRTRRFGGRILRRLGLR